VIENFPAIRMSSQNDADHEAIDIGILELNNVFNAQIVSNGAIITMNTITPINVQIPLKFIRTP